MSDDPSSKLDLTDLAGILKAADLSVPQDRLPDLLVEAGGINELMRSMTATTALGEAPPANQFDARWE